MKNLKSIALIVCYYGKLPWYFSYFIQSCKYNPTIDFYILADDRSYEGPIPPNVKILYKAIDTLKKHINKKLGLTTAILNAYKLCDFKPAYGHIFSEIIKDYDFWGYCDIDVIFGNIRDFMTDDILEIYDIISVRPDWIPGCFLLYKNTPKLNLLYTHSKDFKKVFESSRHYCFDETNFTHPQFEEGRPYYQIKSEVESMMHVVKKMEKQGYIKPYFDLHILEGGRPGSLNWDKGTLTYKKRFDVLLYHLIEFKRFFTPLEIEQPSESFKISTNKIYNKKKPKFSAVKA